MPPRRTRPLKSLKGRVQKLLTLAEFEKTLSKSNKRLVVVHYYTSSSPVQQIQSVRGLLIKVSRQRELSNVLFVEVDVSQPELEGVAADNGVNTLPAFQLWKNQSVVETLTGMALGSVAPKCIELAGSSSEDPPSRWKRLLVGALVLGAIGAAGYVGYRRNQQSGQKKASPAAQLADVDAKIQDVKARLAYVTRRKLHKDKREQQKKLKVLEARRQAIVAGQKARRTQVHQPAAIQSSSSDSD